MQIHTAKICNPISILLHYPIHCSQSLVFTTLYVCDNTILPAATAVSMIYNSLIIELVSHHEYFTVTYCEQVTIWWQVTIYMLWLLLSIVFIHASSLGRFCMLYDTAINVLDTDIWLPIILGSDILLQSQTIKSQA